MTLEEEILQLPKEIQKSILCLIDYLLGGDC